MIQDPHNSKQDVEENNTDEDENSNAIQVFNLIVANCGNCFDMGSSVPIMYGGDAAQLGEDAQMRGILVTQQMKRRGWC